MATVGVNVSKRAAVFVSAEPFHADFSDGQSEPWSRFPTLIRDEGYSPMNRGISDSDFAIAFVADVRDALSAFLSETARYMEHQGYLAKPGSKADTDQRTCARPESIVTACGIGHNLIEASGEYVSAFVKTITEPVEVIACWTCVRAMMESSAMASWLFDPNATELERIGRTFALRYEGMQQQLKFGRVAGIVKKDMDSLEKRIDKLELIALALGFPRIHNRIGDRIGIGQRMPKITELIGMTLDQEKHYRLLSAVAHGHQWAISQLTYAPAAEQTTLSIGNVETTLFQKVAKLDCIGVLGLLTLKGLARALWNQSRYFGWEMNPLEELIENAADKLQLNSANRFWRS